MLKTTTVELHKLVKSSSEAMIIIDCNGQIVQANKELVKLFGYLTKELIGTNLEILLPKSFRKKHAKHLQHYFSNAAIRPMSTGLDLYGCRKDGSEFPVEITLHPFQTEHGALVYAAIRDLSDYKKTEAALRESEIRLKTIVDNMPAAVFLRDCDGRFVFINRTYEEMYGVKNADVRGKALHNVFPKEEAHKYSEHDARVIKEKSVIEEEATARSVKGGIVLSSSKFPILDNSGALTGVAGIEYDITEHKRAIAELEKAESELKEQTNFFRMLGRTADHSNTATTFEEAIQSFLTDVCMFTGWPVGHAYVLPPDGADRLVPTRIWHMHGTDKFAEFRKVTEKTEFEAGVGLPGRVLKSGKAEWITDVTKDANFPRAKLAKDIGVRAGFAIPVLVGSEVVAVLEFFAAEAMEPDDSLLMIFMQTGAQLGRVAERVRAQKELERKETELREMLESSPIGTTIVNADGSFEFVNSRMARMVGLSKEEFLASNARDLYVNPQDRDQVSERLVKEGRLRDIEMQMKKADGTSFWILLSFEPMRSEEHGHFFGWVYDISERKRAELELQESRDTFQALADNLPEFISMKDLEGRFLFVNKRFEEWVCVDRNDVIGKTADDIYPEEQAIVFNRIDREAIESRKVLSQEVKLDYPDGITRGIIRLRFPVFSSDGEMLGLGTVNHDITERKKVEAALRLTKEQAETALADLKVTQERFKTIIDHMPAAVFLRDTEGRFVLVNRAYETMYQVSNDQIRGKSLQEAFPESVAERYAVQDAKVKKSEGVVKNVLTRESKYGLVTIESSKFPIVDEKGTVIGLAGVGHDITERINSEEALRVSKDRAVNALADLKKTQEQLVQSQKMASLGQLTAGIAHEIKNPLNFVNNFAETSVELIEELKEEFQSVRDQFNDESRENVDDLFETLNGDLGKINEHGRRADGIVKSMLLHARGDVSDRIESPLNPLVLEALKLAYHGERAKDKSFQVALDEQLDEKAGAIEVMPQEITRVLVNLFGNAFYAVKKRALEAGNNGYQPTVSITTISSGNGIEIRVRDNGTGIPTDIREKLFEPFFTTKPPGEGTGLGLSMCFDIIVQQHGGQMSVDSKPGEFTEFIIALPRHAGDGLEQEQQSDGETT
jgi:PAS domain S-box-containing protein